MIIDFMAANGLNLLVLGAVAFIQNMFFTWSSRSRNSGDPGYHRKVAWGSNGVWYLCQMLIIKQVWSAIQAGNMALVALAGLVYVIATSEGSVFMMRWLLKREKGDRRVGAGPSNKRQQPKQEPLPKNKKKW